MLHHLAGATIQVANLVNYNIGNQSTKKSIQLHPTDP